VPGVLVLGAIWGASAGPAGIGQVTAVVMSAVVWSGAGQFAALPLWREGIGIVALSVLMLSLRFSLMAASMAPRLSAARVPTPLRGLLAFSITDETYALAMTRRASTFDVWYMIGAWIPVYVPWVVGTLVGVLLGAQVPDNWRNTLEGIFPIVFLTLTVLVCTTRVLALIAALGGVLSVVGALLLPSGWNVLVAGLVASACGPWLEDRLKR
jgi:predicted branched-subunit amino acid permease